VHDAARRRAPVTTKPRRVLRRAIAPVTLAIAAAVPLGAGSASAHGLGTGFADVVYQSANAASRAHWLDKTVDARAGIVRINVKWGSIAVSKPSNPRDPADPTYNFASLDPAVSDAAARHLQPLITVFTAPGWAEGKHRPSLAAAGTWKPRAGALGDFAHALAARYSGSFGGLPRVRYFEAWNEPNLSAYLTPQYKGKTQKSVGIYRPMLNAFYRGVHSALSSDKVLNGGLGPYGEPPGGERTRPLTFMRKLLCLRGQNLKPAKCRSKAHLDVFSDHPIDTSGGPHRSALNPNDAATPDFKYVTRTLRAAERHHRVLPGGHRPLWATEVWWDSNPPDTVEGVPVKTQARWLEEALQILWKQGASVVINLEIRDAKFIRHDAIAPTSTGLFFHSGKPKPSYRAWRFPFVITGRSDHLAKVWGRAPDAGSLKVQEKRHGGWHTVKSLSVASGQIFKARVHASRGRSLRARLGAATSLPAG
jgi:hypothetical protein